MSMMLRFSSGSFTPRSAFRTVSELIICNPPTRKLPVPTGERQPRSTGGLNSIGTGTRDGSHRGVGKTGANRSELGDRATHPWIVGSIGEKNQKHVADGNEQ